MTMLRRRVLLHAPVLLLGAGHLTASGSDDELEAVLRAGGVALLIRHASTESGVGDPSNFRLGDCSTQRNLSAAGRAEARRMGAWFRERGLEPAAVRTSGWCRCIDTAEEAFGRWVRWAPLDSFFQGRGSGEDQVAQMKREATRIAANRFEVWVTHQVNITGASGIYPATAEAVALGGARSGVSVRARHRFGA